MFSTRLWCAVSAGGLAALLLIAAMLAPDGRGHGTHEQLGLAPCTFATLVGQPCPTCGMTTAWSHLTQGNLAAAAKTHVSGTLLGLLAMTSSVWASAYAITGKVLIKLPTERALAFTAAALMALVFVEWILRLAAQGFGAAT